MTRRNGDPIRQVTETGKYLFEAMDFKQPGRLALKPGKTDIAAGFKQVTPQNDQPREGRRRRAATTAQVDHDDLSAAGGGLVGHPACLSMGQTLAGGE